MIDINQNFDENQISILSALGNTPFEHANVLVGRAYVGLAGTEELSNVIVKKSQLITFLINSGDFA